MQLGEDVIELVHGVVGPRGVVELGDHARFCSEVCLRGYVNGSDEQITKVSRRVP